MRKRSISKIGCAISALIIILFIAGFLWAILSWEDDFLFINRQSAHRVSEMFTLALMGNRLEVAQSLVDSSQWSRIEHWIAEHQAASCSPPIGISDEPTWWSVGGSNSNQGSEYRLPVLILALPCPDKNGRYRLTVENIHLRYTEEGWLIEDWDKIIEDWEN